MNKEHTFRAIIILAMVVSIVALSVAYAAFSQTLYINGITTLKSNDWDIRFQNLETPIISGDTEIVAPATLSVTTLNFDISLKKPNDSVSYTWEIKNNGTIDAKLGETPVINGIVEALAKDVTYKFTYDDNTEIKIGDTLNSGTTVKVKLKIALKDTATITSDDTPLNLKTTLIYIQK